MVDCIAVLQELRQVREKCRDDILDIVESGRFYDKLRNLAKDFEETALS